jgi:hypothetical protein
MWLQMYNVLAIITVSIVLFTLLFVIPCIAATAILAKANLRAPVTMPVWFRDAMGVGPLYEEMSHAVKAHLGSGAIGFFGGITAMLGMWGVYAKRKHFPFLSLALRIFAIGAIANAIVLLLDGLHGIKIANLLLNIALHSAARGLLWLLCALPFLIWFATYQYCFPIRVNVGIKVSTKENQ